MDEQTKAALARLREEFPPHQISKLPKPTKQQTEDAKAPKFDGIRCNLCGTWHHPKVVHLDYVGHAALTDRLLDVDPAWEWRPMALDSDGLPKMDKVGGMWIYLTVCGITRPGYGHAEGKSGGDAQKEIIGDALRNAAMRFGCALDLWHKGDLHLEPEEKKEEEKGEEAIGWTIERQEQFSILADRIYSAFLLAGKKDLHPEEAEKWRKRRAEDNPESVLGSMLAFAEKAEKAAAKHKRPDPPAVPPGFTAHDA